MSVWPKVVLTPRTHCALLTVCGNEICGPISSGYIMPCFHLVLIKHHLLEMSLIRVDIPYFPWHGVLTVFLSFRHVLVRTSPNHRYTFTLRTHPSVVPGSIAFSLPQVTRMWIYSLLILKVVKESIHLKQAVSSCNDLDSYWRKPSRCYIRNLKINS